MTGPNHLVGGTVFTGVFCSFWDINIFSKPWYLVAVFVVALLPDIDHKQGILGRTLSFTRLPQYIERNYGHRTITHSLVCYLGLGLVVWVTESILSTHRAFSAIYFFAYASHLIFDMMTVSGVPLFFPFKKNPCVLPANPDYRLKVKDLKSESIVFVCFLGIGIFCFPLMSQGFWTSYNRAFGTLEHLFREYNQSKDFLIVDYDYLSHGEQQKGKGLLLHSEKSKAILFKDDKVFEITSDMKINQVLPTHTTKSRKEKEYFFYNISQDSLTKLYQNKVIVQGEFQSNKTVSYWSSLAFKKSNIITLNYSYNPLFEVVEDTSHTSERRALEIKLIELKEKFKAIENEKSELENTKRKLLQLENNYNKLSLSDKERAVPKIKSLKSKIENFTFSGESTEKIEKQIEHLQEQINENEEIIFTGKLVVLSVL